MSARKADRPMPALLLASGSPRRRQFLQELGFTFTVQPANTDESVQAGEKQLPYALRIARTKAQAVAGLAPSAVVLAADTVVGLDDNILGKPRDQDDFVRMMQLLSGRTHTVVTAVAVQAGIQAWEAAVATEVTFRALGADEIRWYWSTGEPLDKAGGYALQGRGGAFVSRIEGSHSGVIGLPLTETLDLLQRAGIPLPWNLS